MKNGAGLPQLSSEAAANWPLLTEILIDNVRNIYFSTKRTKTRKRTVGVAEVTHQNCLKKQQYTTILFIGEDWRQDNRL